MRGVAAAPFSVPAAGEVDDHRSHDAAGPAHEVDAVLEPQAAGAGEAEVGLVDER